MSANLTEYGSIDNSQKTITVPPGGGLAADLKGVLKQDGWTLVVDRGPDVENGTIGQNLHIEEFSTFQTRYRLMLDDFQVDLCIGHLDPAYNYDLSFVDNKTGEEVMVMSGKACQHQIINRFREFLNSGD